MPKANFVLFWSLIHFWAMPLSSSSTERTEMATATGGFGITMPTMFYVYTSEWDRHLFTFVVEHVTRALCEQFLNKIFNTKHKKRKQFTKKLPEHFTFL